MLQASSQVLCSGSGLLQACRSQVLRPGSRLLQASRSAMLCAPRLPQACSPQVLCAPRLRSEVLCTSRLLQASSAQVLCTEDGLLRRLRLLLQEAWLASAEAASAEAELVQSGQRLLWRLQCLLQLIVEELFREQRRESFFTTFRYASPSRGPQTDAPACSAVILKNDFCRRSTGSQGLTPSQFDILRSEKVPDSTWESGTYFCGAVSVPTWNTLLLNAGR